MTISLRARLADAYHRLGVPIFHSRNLPGAARGTIEGERERNQRSTIIRLARLVCLAKAFLRPAIDPATRICRCTVPPGVFLLLSVFSITKKFLAHRFAADRVQDCIAKIRSRESASDRDLLKKHKNY